jgi:hypothetical protein
VKRVRRREVLLLALVVLVFAPAPTVGDVGGCGAPAEEIDPARYATSRKHLDCRRCTECGLATQRCTSACDDKLPPDEELPSSCHPLVQDAKVCLNALVAASCRSYAGYVADESPTSPSECDFCRLQADGAPAR